MSNVRSPITLTESAIIKVKELIRNREKETAGIRIGINSKGCSGMSYTFEYADEILNNDESVEISDFKILIDPKSLLFVIGTEIDFVDEGLESGFKFSNPNAKSICGCNKSFRV